MTEQVILVNELDEEIGTAEKLHAHQAGLLHRAFSVLIYNSKGEMLIQRRANDKYHSANLWSNACCSHPRPGELVKNAAIRRLREEIGLTCSLEEKYKFRYRADFEDGLSECEMDYVLEGVCDQNPTLNPDEASDFRYMSIMELKAEMRKSPDNFTEWFKLIMNKMDQE